MEVLVGKYKVYCIEDSLVDFYVGFRDESKDEVSEGNIQAITNFAEVCVDLEAWRELVRQVKNVLTWNFDKELMHPIYALKHKDLNKSYEWNVVVYRSKAIVDNKALERVTFDRFNCRLYNFSKEDGFKSITSMTVDIFLGINEVIEELVEKNLESN